MKSKVRKNQIPVLEGSGNVFADLGLADADDLRFKAELARQICNRIKKLKLTQVQAATRQTACLLLSVLRVTETSGSVFNARR